MVSCRQPLTLLKQVEEIRVNYQDIDRIRDFITKEWTCTADIVIYLPKEQMINWDVFAPYKDLLKITIAVEDTSMIEEAASRGYKVFWSYPASTFWELKGLLDLGVNQVLLDAPIYFSLNKVRHICGDNVELRINVNQCMNGYMKRKDGVCGTYVRPEDVDEYAKYIQHMEFSSDSLKQEQTLYHIYAENKHWPGNLNLLLTYLNEDVDNRGFEILPTDDNDTKFFAHRRMNCGQKCLEDGRCNMCYSVFRLINNIDKHSDEILAAIDKNNKAQEISG